MWRKVSPTQENLNVVSPRAPGLLGPLLFLLYVNDMPGAVGCEVLLYTDNACLVFQAKDLNTISDRLNTEFNKLCDWFVDNKLSIHFGEDKSILLTGKNRPKADNLNISRGRIKVAQHKEINYLCCRMDEKSSWESMALNGI